MAPFRRLLGPLLLFMVALVALPCFGADLVESQEPDHHISKRSVFTVGNWCSGFQCATLRDGIYPRYSNRYSYHFFTLQRTIDVSRYPIRRSYTSSRLTQVNQLQFCATGDDLHAAQAICNNYDSGDAQYVYSDWYNYGTKYRRYSSDGNVNIQLAELICPPHTSGIYNCKVNILPHKSSCRALYVQCMKGNCYRRGNSIYSRTYNRYGQICDHNCCQRNYCHGQCFRCRYLSSSYYKYWGRACLRAYGTGTGQEIWEPHFKTFDGRHYDFQGQCSYYQVKLDDVSIAGQYEICGEQSVTCLTALDIKIGKTQLKVGPRNHFEIFYDGQEQPAKKPYCNEDLCFYEGSDLHDIVDLMIGIKVVWDRRSEVNFVIAPRNAGLLSGLFGNFDGDPSNDFLMPNGTQAKNEVEFGESWVVEGSCGGRNTSGRNPVITPEMRKKAAETCDVLKSEAFAECNKTADRDVIYENCIMDVATCSPSNNVSVCLCPSLEEYVELCSADGQIIPAWRDRIPRCRDKCPAGQTFKTCGDSCESSCHRRAAKQVECLKSCVEGCFCADGMTKGDDGVCIPVDRCPVEEIQPESTSVAPFDDY